MDKRKKSLSGQVAGIRGWIQAAATLLTNIHIPNFFKGKIYQGKFEEFYPDMDELKEIVINLFYKEKA